MKNVHYNPVNLVYQDLEERSIRLPIDLCSAHLPRFRVLNEYHKSNRSRCCSIHLPIGYRAISNYCVQFLDDTEFPELVSVAVCSDFDESFGCHVGPNGNFFLPEDFLKLHDLRPGYVFLLDFISEQDGIFLFNVVKPSYTEEVD